MPSHASIPWLPLAACLLIACGQPQSTDPPYPPGAFGPHAVGFSMLGLYDQARDRPVTTAVWYPAQPKPEADRVFYLALLQAEAVEDAEPDRSAGPYPLILFSHGNQGVAVQSPSLCEHLASQGFVVAAPTHEGNTLFDSPSDEEMAVIARQRPQDVFFAQEQLLSRNGDLADPLHGLIDDTRIGLAGHSFGGFTALLMAGATVDVDQARLRCEAGLPGDVFCPAIANSAPGTVLARPPGAGPYRACLALAPGSWGAFGSEGLTSLEPPVMLMGGTHDEYTSNDLRPIFDHLPTEKFKVELDRAGHLAFTDVCRMGLPVPELVALCDPESHLDTETAFAIIHHFAAVFLRIHLRGDAGLQDALDLGAAAWPEAHLDRG